MMYLVREYLPTYIAKLRVKGISSWWDEVAQSYDIPSKRIFIFGVTYVAKLWETLFMI